VPVDYFIERATGMPLRTLQDGQESVVQDEGEKEIVEDGE